MSSIRYSFCLNSIYLSFNQTVSRPIIPNTPVTIQPAGHDANTTYHFHKDFAKDAYDLINKACKTESPECHEIFQSSFSTTSLKENNISPTNNGFVHTVVDSDYHYHLTIRLFSP
ncbi:hypothetical protein ABVK25_002859 [Lepraria finkii]|uniref:Uncharacterized protein n=1 Tax=Lepraria finkii TaxID=1340010 RepID=A0ABR4BHI0_9LECA